MAKGKKTKWTEEQILMLGTMSDIELGRIMGISKSTVVRKRRELGIPSWRSKLKRPNRGEYSAEWYSQNKERYVVRNLRVNYGIALEDYNVLLEEQGEGCAICGKTPEENGERLAVDHDHQTGKIRGLLCGFCNRGLGMFQDNQTLLLRAVEYLEE